MDWQKIDLSFINIFRGIICINRLCVLRLCERSIFTSQAQHGLMRNDFNTNIIATNNSQLSANSRNILHIFIYLKFCLLLFSQTTVFNPVATWKYVYWKSVIVLPRDRLRLRRLRLRPRRSSATPMPKARKVVYASVVGGSTLTLGYLGKN